MLIGTLVYSVFRLWLTMVQIVAVSPALVIKVGFLWFGMAFAMSYIFFLLVHKADVVHVRKELAIGLARSLVMSFLVSSLLISLYEFILNNLSRSKFFVSQRSMVQNLSLTAHDPYDLYMHLCCLMVILSGLFAAHYVGAILDQWYGSKISNRYGWSILVTTLLCWGFLCSVNYVI